MKTIASLQYVTQEVPGRSYAETTDMVCSAGVTWVQLRVKGLSFIDWVRVARSVKFVCERYHATLIINDSPFVAKEVQANGVHLGQRDLDTEEARRILGEKAIIGGTANTLEQAMALSNKWVDYIGLGPLRFTTTKSELSPLLGFAGISSVISGMRSAGSTTPVIVIGGVTPADVAQLKAGGAHGVAVSSALTNVPDTASSVREFLSL